jgi:class I fructose-bisphosphate aldolase
MQITSKVQNILGWYESDNVGTKTNLARILMEGKLGGTGKMIILPVDQGFEHGPARSFSKNPDGYDPYFHATLAVESGCNAYAAPLGAIETIARDFAGEIPLILKINNSDSLFSAPGPCSAVTSSVDDALRLGCAGIGFTIYPGSSLRKQMYEEIAAASRRAKEMGLVVVIWSYPRGEKLSKAGETGIDVVAYAAHIAAQLGAHFIKVKPPTEHIEQAEAKKVFESHAIPIKRMSDRIRHIVDSCFNGKRVVIFSGGEAKSTEDLMSEVKEIAEGGGFGSIMGRNAFQRPKKEAIQLLHNVMDTFVGKV